MYGCVDMIEEKSREILPARCRTCWKKRNCEWIGIAHCPDIEKELESDDE